MQEERSNGICVRSITDATACKVINTSLLGSAARHNQPARGMREAEPSGGVVVCKRLERETGQ